MKIITVVLPAFVLGIVGAILGYYAKGGVLGAIVSCLAGAAGGGIAGYAALGVMCRVANTGRRAGNSGEAIPG